MRTVCILTAAGAILSSAAMAQVPARPGHPSDQLSGTAAPVTDPRQQIRTNLQQAGFSDVRVIPDAFLVQARDKSGKPITIMINPGSVTIMAATGPATSRQADVTTGPFTTVPASDRMSSSVVGVEVYNKDFQDIGTIKDVAYDAHGIKAYIVGVGGFLSMGERYVAVTPSAIQVAYDANLKIWHAAMNTTADDVRAAPEFKYPAQG